MQCVHTVYVNTCVFMCVYVYVCMQCVWMCVNVCMLCVYAVCVYAMCACMSVYMQYVCMYVFCVYICMCSLQIVDNDLGIQYLKVNIMAGSFQILSAPGADPMPLHSIPKYHW